MFDTPPPDEAAPPPSRWNGRYVFLGAAIGFGLCVAAALVALWWLRDPLPALDESALDAAEARWNEHGPSSYDLDLRLGGARPGDVHVEVRDGAVTAMTRDGVTPSQRRTWDAWTVAGQFDTLWRELELAADPEGEMQADARTRLVLRAAFDPELGYPVRYRRTVIGMGPEVSWEVVRFTPVP